MDSIGYLTSVPILETAVPLLTLGADKEIVLALMSLKLKKATEPHVHHHHHHEQQEIIRLINKFFLFLSSCFSLQFAFVLNRYLFRYYNTELFQVFTVFYITFLKIQECYVCPHYTGRKVNVKHLPQPVQYPTGCLSQSQDLSPRILFPSLILPHLSAFKGPVCLLLSHTQPCWKVALIIHSSIHCPLDAQPLSLGSCLFWDFKTPITRNCKVVSLKGYKPKQPICVAWAKFKSCLKVLWFYFHFSS